MLLKLSTILIISVFTLASNVFVSQPIVFAQTTSCIFAISTTSPSIDPEYPFIVTVTKTKKDHTYTVNVDARDGSGDYFASQKATSDNQELIFTIKLSEAREKFDQNGETAEVEVDDLTERANCTYLTTGKQDVSLSVHTGPPGPLEIPEGPRGDNPCKGGSCETALGEIPTSTSGFASMILFIATGLAGGIALIFMVIGAIRVLTSSGDQQKLNGGRDMIVAALSGLLFLIFSVLILKFLGQSLLGRVPGF